MNSPHFPDLPCEGPGCPAKTPPTFYCETCDSNFCDLCWPLTPPHIPGKQQSGKAHDKVDRVVVKNYERTFERRSESDRSKLHRDDDESTWFGMSQNHDGDPIFEDYEQYITLMSEGLSTPHKTRYPKLVSFIGGTGAGKSTLVKLLMQHGQMESLSVENFGFSTPVAGLSDDSIPVSANVHLYGDPDTHSTEKPILFADCEGLDGGEIIPKAEESKINDDANGLRPTNEKIKIGSRKVCWAAKGNDKGFKREDAVAGLYPKLLYTFSDVVVFVMQTHTKTLSTVIKRAIRWALVPFEKSLGQPTLPHLVVAINKTDYRIDEDQWDSIKAKRKILGDFESLIDTDSDLRDDAKKWRTHGKKIENIEDLLCCYFSSITFVRLPTKERYMLLHKQVKMLHSVITESCERSQYWKWRTGMLSNSEDLQVYFQHAYDHFSEHFDEPFDFVEIALQIRPIPSDFAGNIVRLAKAIYRHQPSINFVDIFNRLSRMVASCIMLDIQRYNRPGNPFELLRSHYRRHCEMALKEFSWRHWPCEFSKKNVPCVLKAMGHEKGHQSAKGTVLATGNYQCSYRLHEELESWMANLGDEMDNIQWSKDKSNPSHGSEELASKLHTDRLHQFYRNTGSANEFKSHVTCFCCLTDVPLHPLPCGHVLCDSCARSYGKPNGKGSVEILECPLEDYGKPWPKPRVIKIFPQLAGIRVLSLDGGGVRGIVELEVLHAIEKHLPKDIPIRGFFDLMVGTSTGGIIALGLGVAESSVEESITEFMKLCDDAFRPRNLQNVPVINWFEIVKNKNSQYKSKPLEAALRSSYRVAADEAIFGGQHSFSSVKVAVTSALSTGKPAVLFTNYNRPTHGSREPQYLFERAQNPDFELKVWEAARASSAAPLYFKPFKHERTKREYVDGGFFFNNPTKVADSERRLIWPDTRDSPPDILLSIGTSCNDSIASTLSTLSLQGFDPGDIQPFTLPKKKRLRGWKPRIYSRLEETYAMAKGRVDDIIDCENTWLKFMAELHLDEDERKRYQRLNPNIKEEPPALDETLKVRHLQGCVQRVMSDSAYQRQVGEIARRLVASSFYIDAGSLRIRRKEIRAYIHCKFPSGGLEIGSLGEYFTTNKNFQPFFLIREKDSNSQTKKIVITTEIIHKMVNDRSFEVPEIQLPVSNTSAKITISLSLLDKEEFAISGFPRTLVRKKPVKAPSSSSHTPLHEYPSQIPIPDDDTSDQNFWSEESDYDYESGYQEWTSVCFEVEDLPKEAKLPISRFLKERIAAFEQRGELVPRIVVLLNKAASIEPEDKGDGGADDSGKGPYGTILHTASAIGNLWLLEMQIEVGVDVDTLDDHEWKAYMVAKAQGHLNCAKRLSAHAEDLSGYVAVTTGLPPSGLVSSTSNPILQIGPDQLTAAVSTLDFFDVVGRLQIRANHPIPPNCEAFYYEMKIEESGPFGVIGLGLCRPETYTFGLPGEEETSWGYHGDIGRIFNGLSDGGRRYADVYTKNDTVGCGIKVKTGEMFFTVNGKSLGVAFTNVKGMLFPVIGFQERECRLKVNFGKDTMYDITTHNWTVPETATPTTSIEGGTD